MHVLRTCLRYYRSSQLLRPILWHSHVTSLHISPAAETLALILIHVGNVNERRDRGAVMEEFGDSECFVYSLRTYRNSTYSQYVQSGEYSK